jgi:hypothetical protein
MATEFCFLKHDVDVFRVAAVVRYEGDSMIVKEEGQDTERKVKRSDITIISENELVSLKQSPPVVCDLIHLTTVSQETILYVLQRQVALYIENCPPSPAAPN